MYARIRANDAIGMLEKDAEGAEFGPPALAIRPRLLTRRHTLSVSVGVVAPVLLKPLVIEPAQAEREIRKTIEEQVKKIENLGGRSRKAT